MGDFFVVEHLLRLVVVVLVLAPQSILPRVDDCESVLVQALVTTWYSHILLPHYSLIFETSACRVR